MLLLRAIALINHESRRFSRARACVLRVFSQSSLELIAEFLPFSFDRIKRKTYSIFNPLHSYLYHTYM